VLGALSWRALECGQYDDLERPARDILADERTPESGTYTG
jgi:cbb3-type cytochrome oxidase maturation protein